MKQISILVIFLASIILVANYHKYNSISLDKKNINSKLQDLTLNNNDFNRPTSHSESAELEDLKKIKKRNKRKVESTKYNKKTKLSKSKFQYDLDFTTEQDETNQVEFILPELQIDNSHKIEYYYPYFYKTHIIEYNDVINYQALTNECSDLGCQWCDNFTRQSCSECRHSFYLYNNRCYSSCPEGFVADIFKKKCTFLNLENPITSIAYLKAFTVGSCKNICGDKSVDCSCHPSCRLQGNCCSDFQLCENLKISNSVPESIQECRAKVPNCDMCNSQQFGKIQCGNCLNGFFLRNGECVASCLPSDTIVPSNKICIKNQDCRVENCSECVDGNPSVCKHCTNGFYMHNNQCLNLCPINYRADRISWTCLENPVFAWYWVFPSITSCLKRCGMVISEGIDCSCSNDCFRYGNCCQDIEDYCPELNS